MRFYTTVQLSANQELTPEGYLLCRNVPIARTGTQLYAATELPLRAVDGVIRIERHAEDVFHPDTMASFEAKPVVVDHPTEDVGPENWARLSKGIVQNVRRGSNIEDDLLLADLLITDAQAIEKVKDGLREVSCGYDAEYEQLEPGRGRQHQIVGNHLALVDQGRCGSRCAIGDSMKKLKWMDRLRAAFTARDEEEFKKALEESAKDSEPEETEEEKKKREAKEEADKKTSDSLSNLSKSLDALSERLEKLEAKDAAEEESETEEEKKKREAEEVEAEKEKSGDKKSRDSAAQLAEAQDVFARVEILSPGMALPTNDAARSQDGLCALKRKALDAAYANPKTRDAVAPLVAGKDLSKLTCDALHSTFVGASEIVRRENNAHAKVTFDSGKHAHVTASTISDMNRRNSQFWARS
jgi:hypothetical protein